MPKTWLIYVAKVTPRLWCIEDESRTTSINSYDLEVLTPIEFVRFTHSDEKPDDLMLKTNGTLTVNGNKAKIS